MSALTRDDLFTIMLALEAMITDVSRKQRAALKRRDDAALERLSEIGGKAIEAKRKVVGLRG